MNHKWKIMSNRSGKFWRFGTVVGLVVALVVTSFFTLWAWLSNPGGILRLLGLVVVKVMVAFDYYYTSGLLLIVGW